MNDPILFAGYMLLHKLGTGGMAEAFLARSVSVGSGGREVVLKRMLTKHLEDKGIRSEFLNEARLMSLFSHPNVIQVIDFGEDNGVPYLVLEYIHGCDLASLIHRAGLADRRFTEDISLYIMTELLEGLSAVHSATGKDGKNLEILHGDINPANIFISYDGSVKIGDFGIAKTAQERQKTAKGIVKGKIGYLAPEQLVMGRVDTRADLFAAGIVMWELLSGRRLYAAAPTQEILTRICKEATPPLSKPDGVSPDLEKIVMKALQKNPGMRFKNASEFSAGIAGYMESTGKKPQFRGLRNFIHDVLRDRIEEDKKTIETVLRHAGRIEQRSLPRVFADLLREQATGRLHVEIGSQIRNVFFGRGSVRFATSTIQAEMLGEHLVSKGIITAGELEKALLQSKEQGTRLGETLVAMELLQLSRLVEVLQDQVRVKLVNLFSWVEGAYMFYPNEKLDDESIQLEPSTPRLVLEGIMEQMPEEHIETVLGTFMELRPVIEFDEYVNQDSLALHPREFRVLRSILKAETLGKALDSATAGGHVSRKCAISIAYVLHEAGVLKLK